VAARGRRAVVADRDRQEVNIRFGYTTSSLLRAKPPPSKWLVAPGPVRPKSHFAPTTGRLRHFNAGATETGSFEAYCT